MISLQGVSSACGGTKFLMTADENTKLCLMIQISGIN